MERRHIISWLLQSSCFRKPFNQKGLTLLLVIFSWFVSSAQVANYISNGSFEDAYDCNWPNLISKAKYWMSIDSTSYAGDYMSSCPNYGLVPQNGYTFQYPKSGIAYALCGWYFITNNPVQRGYLKNRLKKKHESGKTYCVKFHINISNNSTYGMDGFGIYFGNGQIDTITKCTYPLSYIHPQVKNPIGNIITDTLNWTAITGTFIANGTEKYALLGNFLANSAVDTTFFNPTNYPLKATDVCIDDVSCIDIDLPAYAGHDTTCIPGTSVYIGRPQDVGIDEACMWYKLPIVITPTTPALDTAAGIWVSPTETSTYVVRQEICGGIKWDTVVVFKDWVGINGKSLSVESIKLFPNPANNELTLSDDLTRPNDSYRLIFTDQLGQIIRQEEIEFTNKQVLMDISSLSQGVYIVTISDRYGAAWHSKLVISR